MVEHAEEFVWSGEGEGAEILINAPDETTAEAAFARTLTVADLPGVRNPVWAAVSQEGFGHVAVSDTHTAPDLVSVTSRGLLLISDAPADGLGIPPRELANLVLRNAGEASRSLPSLAANSAAVARLCEEGAVAVAEDGLMDEDDLAFFDSVEGDPDALGREALAAGGQNDGRFELEVAVVGEVLDSDGAETLDLGPGMLALLVRVGAGDLGGRSLGTHRGRILNRIRAGVDFGAGTVLPAAPAETEEAADLILALNAAANFADARAARTLYVLRRVLEDVTGNLGVRASWKVGGIEARDGFVHRKNLAACGTRRSLVSGGVVAGGTGKMWSSAPPFGAPEVEGRWPWEEAGLLERWAALEGAGGEG